MSRPFPSRLRIVQRLFFSGTAIFTVIISASLFWNIKREKAVAEHFAKVEATADYNKDFVYRQWASSKGGLYVPVTEHTPPNPDLAHIPERDISTPSGKALTLMNPAYMMRQVQEFGANKFGIKGHITSLNPIRPQNAPDPWEKEALRSFEKGTKEISAVTTVNEAPYFRLMRPMITEKSCLKCHAKQGYKEGEVRGGISVSVPMSAYEALARSNISRLIISHALMLFMILAGSIVVYRKSRRELSARAAAEKTLKESEERYRRLAQAVFEAVAVSRDDRFIDVSRQIEAIYGLSVEEFINSDVDSLIHPDDLEMVKKNVRENVRGPYQCRGIRKDGAVVHLEIRTEAVFIKEVPCRMTVIRDITELKQMQEQLRQAEKMQAMGRLAGGIAHDFNNILGAIMGYTDMALDEVRDESSLHHKLTQVLKASQRAEHLVSQILTFSRQCPQHKQPVFLTPLVKEVLELIKAVTPSSIEFKTALRPDTKPVLADPSQIHEVLMNLTGNAVSAMNEKGGKGTLTVALFEKTLTEALKTPSGNVPPGLYSVIEVTDTGQGMSDTVKSRIFDPFFTTKPVGEGTGMGLSVVLGIVQAHEGVIEVLSAPEKGSTFRIFLPKTQKEPDAAADKTRVTVPGTERILFIDDEKMIVDMAHTMLENIGYRVVAETNPVAALARFKQNPDHFDLLITDQTMPEMTGVELARAALEIRPSLPVILCTGFSTTVGPKEAEAVGIRKFCMKPITKKEISAVIRNLLDDGHNVPSRREA
jgi:PAS domain S-box-containing protein